MNVLILGGGGREHALAWAAAKSPALGRLVCAPGNAGTARLGRNVAVDPADAASVIALAREEEIDLVIVGPEAPLVAGVADALRAEGTAVFGPGAAGARLEGSKAFAKEIMRETGVPTARSAVVTGVAEAAKALEWIGPRAVVKADGLAAGKGVLMTGGRDETLKAVRECVEERRFGDAGARVVLEEWLEGEEASLIALVDGAEIRALVPSQDHKRAHDGDRGPNTGGMGAYAPYPGLAGAELDAAVKSCLAPVAEGLLKRGVEFRGVLYAGLMLTADGPKVLEYNVRFGDPETQVVLPMADGDLLEAFAACARGELASAPALPVRPGAALTVVAAADGYPESYAKGMPIRGLEVDDDRGDAVVFHAGTKTAGDRVVTSGGRVLAVTGLGATLADAKDAAYAALGTIEFEGMFHRNDIGARGLAMAGASKGESA
ncbi:MAG TPA: phosphoribosylamine--glycine ligase [bacterium]|nr:phosphoribosylamine--glycine ligase [bacterium]